MIDACKSNAMKSPRRVIQFHFVAFTIKLFVAFLLSDSASAKSSLNDDDFVSISLKKSGDGVLNIREKNERTIWKSDGLGLRLTQGLPFSFSSEFSFQSMAMIPKNQLLSVIKTNLGSDLQNRLRKHPRLLLDDDNGVFAAMVLAPKNRAELNDLAAAAHLDGGLCGKIETFSLDRSFSLQSTERLLPWFHSRVKFDPMVKILESFDLEQLMATIESLESLGSRHHSLGSQTTQKISSLFDEVITSESYFKKQVISHRNDITDQSSLIYRHEGETAPDEVVIIGAHLDSIASDPLNAPGADDDATGIAILIEIARLFSSESFKTHRSIELHAYAAEEIGLVGSQDIAKRYRDEGKKIAGMLQLDMSAFGAPSDEGKIYFIDGDTSSDLIRRAINYTMIYQLAETGRGSLPSGATSDHKSWYDQGFPSLFAFENPSNYNPHIHTANDTVQQFNNKPLLLNLARLTSLFISYHAGLMDLDETYEEKKHLAWPEFEEDASLRLYLTQKDEKVVFAVSAPIEARQLEICKIKQKSDTGCSQRRFILSETIEKATRRLFFSSSESIEFEKGDRWRMEAFDENNRLLSYRQFELFDASGS